MREGRANHPPPPNVEGNFDHERFLRGKLNGPQKLEPFLDSVDTTGKGKRKRSQYGDPPNAPANKGRANLQELAKYAKEAMNATATTPKQAATIPPSKKGPYESGHGHGVSSEAQASCEDAGRTRQALAPVPFGGEQRPTRNINGSLS